MRNLIRFLKLNVQLDSSARTPLTTHLPKGVSPVWMRNSPIGTYTHTHTHLPRDDSLFQVMITAKVFHSQFTQQEAKGHHVWPQRGHFNNGSWGEATICRRLFSESQTGLSHTNIASCLNQYTVMLEIRAVQHP